MITDNSSNYLKADFKGRTTELENICKLSSKIYLYNFYGEAGIGKTSLLFEARDKIEQEEPGAKVFYIDLYNVSGQTENRVDETVRLIVRQAEGIIRGAWQNAEQVAGLMVNSLNQYSVNNPVVMMFDTTEALQEDYEYWNWLETHIVGPLVIENRVHLVFAGRVPVPWRRFEVRRAAETQSLEPLAKDSDSRDLVVDILAKRGTNVTQEHDIEIIYNAIYGLSKGHPLLSELLANEIASRWPEIPTQQVLCAEVIEPTIRQTLFANIPAPWDEILWWISPLDSFDDTFIQFYLKKVAPDLVQDQRDFFFGQGLTDLNIKYSVILKDSSGSAKFHGVIGEITRNCFKIIRPDDYYKANQAAAYTYRMIADQFLKETESLFTQYKNMAEAYQQRNT